MGSDDRFAYIAMGHAVNLVSRLEGQTKTYRVGGIIGETTRAAAPSWAALELDLIAVKGKQEAVRIYTLLGDSELVQSGDFIDQAKHHERMLARYRAQDWDAARAQDRDGGLAALAECKSHMSSLAGFYDVYAEVSPISGRFARAELGCRLYNWDAVYTTESN
jgi:adenylate cyclase